MVILYYKTNCRNYYYDVPIFADFFRYFEEGEQHFLTISWLLDPNIIDEKSSNTKVENKKEKWKKNIK
jgi:hypothetical protein